MTRRLASTRFGLVFVAAVAALGLCELAVRTLRPQDLSGTWLVPAGTSDYLVNKSTGSAPHQFDARRVRYTFAPPHLRGPRPSGRFTILVLGDSFAFGHLLRDDDTFVSRLQARADASFGPAAIAFLNAGTSGSCTADQVAYYEDFGLEADADAVLVFANTMDLERSLVSRAYRLDPGSNTLSRPEPAVRTRVVKTLLNRLPFYEAVLERSHLAQLTRRAVLLRGKGTVVVDGEPAGSINDPTGERGLVLGHALFERLAALTNARGHDLVVTTTGWHKFHRQRESTERFTAGAPAFFAGLGVPYMDITARVFQQAAGDSLGITIPGDGHPDEHGAAIIADAAWDVLEPWFRTATRAP